MCDASDHAMGAVLGQSKDKKAVVINYTSRTLYEAQRIIQQLRRSHSRSCTQWRNLDLISFALRSSCALIILLSSTSLRGMMRSLTSSGGLYSHRSLICRSRARRGPRMSLLIISQGLLLRAKMSPLMTPFLTSISLMSLQSKPHGL